MELSLSESQVLIILKISAGVSYISNSKRKAGVIKENITLKMIVFCLVKDKVLKPSEAGEGEDEGDAAGAGEGVLGTRC